MHQVYMGEESGPFRCDHCEYYADEDRCNNRHIIEFAKKRMYGLTLENGLAVVDAGGCSDEFKRNSKMPISDYFGGKGKKVAESMKKTYGGKKGKKVFYATANKLDVAPSGKKK